MELYTPKDLMQKLYINRNLVYELLRTGKIKSIRIGKQYRISKEELEKFINSM
jgi:excisionase family DNA binding protein